MAAIDRRGFLTGLGALALSACTTQGRPAAAGFPIAGGRIDLPRSPALDPDKPLTRIGIGSCFSQDRHGRLLGTAIRSQPDLFLMMGDNVYGDTESPNVDELIAAYAGRGPTIAPSARRCRLRQRGTITTTA